MILYMGANINSMKKVLLRIELNSMFPKLIFLILNQLATLCYCNRIDCKIVNLMLVTCYNPE